MGAQNGNVYIILHAWAYCNHNACVLVSSDTNFEMKQTGLTVGGFIQPSVARNLLKQHANIRRGLCQCFLWFVPKPIPIPFDELDNVDEDFSSSLDTCM